MKATQLARSFLTFLGGVLMVGCQSGPEREPLRAIDRPIQLERFMGRTRGQAVPWFRV